MNNNDRDAIVILINKLEGDNKETLNDLIKKSSHSADTIKALVSAIMPSHAKCKHLLSEDTYNYAVKLIAAAIYITHSKKEHDAKIIEYVSEVIAVVKSAMKKERKATEDLFRKQVKTNFTESQHDKVKQGAKSLNCSVAAFVRDAALNALDIKPRKDNEFEHYFEETSKLSKAIRNISENFDDKKATSKLSSQLKELKKLIDSTRKLAVDSHSSVTAKILAKKYLSARQLEILLKEKLEEEKNQ